MAVRDSEVQIIAETPIDEEKIEQWDTAKEALVGRIKTIVGELHAVEIETMNKAIDTVLDTSDVSGAESTLALKLTGQQHSKEEATSLEITSLIRYFNKRKELLQNSLTGADGVMEGLPEVLKALEGSAFTKFNWLNAPNPYLNRLTPVETLQRGQKAKVLKEAIALGAW